jgi:diguanylate cyclase (GGDEF)-like protein
VTAPRERRRGAVETPLVNRLPQGRREIPILRVSAGGDVFRHVVLRRGGSVEIGREADCALVLGDASISRHHARVTGVGATFEIEDLGSRNGTFLNDQRVSRQALRSGDRVELGSVPLRYERVNLAELAHLRRVLERLEGGDRDPLTGLLTRAYLDAALPQRLEEADKDERALSAVFLDVDHFKEINDGLGHARGDDVLRQVARLVAFGARESEACVRYGGEELLVILEGAAEPAAAQVAERLRRAIAAHDWSRVAIDLQVSVSCGVAERRPKEAQRDWLERADRALYAAKHAGRNRVRRAGVLD